MKTSGNKYNCDKSEWICPSASELWSRGKNNFSTDCYWQFSFVKDWICKHSISRNSIFLSRPGGKNRTEFVLFRARQFRNDGIISVHS